MTQFLVSTILLILTTTTVSCISILGYIFIKAVSVLYIQNEVFNKKVLASFMMGFLNHISLYFTNICDWPITQSHTVY